MLSQLIKENQQHLKDAKKVSHKQWYAGVCYGLKLAKSRARFNATVEVLGGVAEVTRCSKNVRVCIIDHDNENG